MDKLDYADKRCLVVEDRRPFLNLLKGLLSSLGAKKIDTEMSAETGLKACKKAAYDIIVCDLHLGTNRKNGFEFLEEVRKLHLIKPSAVFIMISGDSARSMVLGSLEKQPDDYLVKPFSQAQLNARITRAKNKRLALSALYSQIEHEKYELSIDTCEHFLEVGTKYTAHCVQILVQLYWKTEQYDKAEAILSKLLKQRSIQWALSAMAKTKLLKQEFQDAIDLAKQAIDASRNDVESYDILSQAYFENNMPEDALKYIKDAIALSPLSIDRQFKVCEIARANGDFNTAMQSSQSIFELSQRSVHRDVNHMCSYVRSILDAAEHADQKKESIRLMQEAELTVKKIKLDESALKIQKGFDFEVFEKLINARILHLNNNITQSKVSLEEAQIKIEQQFVDYPAALAADSLKLMLDLGDFEEALKVKKSLEKQGEKLDPNVALSISSSFDTAAENQKNYIRLNKLGISDYSEGKYQSAYDTFKEAKSISPTNIGVTLNLLQSIVKLLENNEAGNNALQQECREHYRFVKNMPLRDVHKQKFETIQDDIEKVMQ
ncbi:response regulator [Glaciecola sp. MH2013]|uniref:response regulator n=1 Tax=Glaciecola sp. MH2013 TaxID=2785524 RepID=UPI00189E18C5|nr:response regulator [Glaciecola sp. MH2013]MBF7072721.1 response regulator [Glaciecola sp. MH2013]